MKLRFPARLRRPARPQPPLPDNPYHRFYTRPRRLEELIPRPPDPQAPRGEAAVPQPKAERIDPK